ncbi:hypothetical protein BDR04DRAFT_1144435 [Suillus decipiens]|nr:hypothetical protein BDR04DRAFT_1144435 [Suillus decipiens]
MAHLPPSHHPKGCPRVSSTTPDPFPAQVPRLRWLSSHILYTLCPFERVVDHAQEIALPARLSFTNKAEVIVGSAEDKHEESDKDGSGADSDTWYKSLNAMHVRIVWPFHPSSTEPEEGNDSNQQVEDEDEHVQMDTDQDAQPPTSWIIYDAPSIALQSLESAALQHATPLVVAAFLIDEETVTFWCDQMCHVCLYYPEINGLHAEIMLPERNQSFASAECQSSSCFSEERIPIDVCRWSEGWILEDTSGESNMRMMEVCS